MINNRFLPGRIRANKLAITAGLLFVSTFLTIAQENSEGTVISADQFVFYSCIGDPRVEDGVLKADLVSTDPWVATDELTGINAADYEFIVIRMSVPFGTDGQLYWATDTEPSWSDNRYSPFRLKPKEGMQEYVLATQGLPEWQGTIMRIRVDPVADAQEIGEFAIESVKLIKKKGLIQEKKLKSSKKPPSEVKSTARTSAELRDIQPAKRGPAVRAHIELPAAPEIAPIKEGDLFTSNGMLLVDGRPIFPLGLSDLPILKSPFAETRTAGFHYFISVGLSPALFDSLRKNDLKVMYYPASLYSSSLTSEAGRAAFKPAETMIEGNEDAIFGYFAADEPAWNDHPLEKMKEAWDVLSHLPKRKPVFLNHAPRGTPEELKEYNQYADVTGVDIYPVPEGTHMDIPNKTISSVGDYTDKMFASATPGQPVWMYLQAFAWEDALPLPTFKETRFMAYNAILHGAQGLLWFGLDRLKWPENEMWPQLKRVGMELRGLEDMLVAPWTGPLNEKALKGGFEIRHKNLGGVHYLVIANKNPLKKKLKWTVSEKIPRFNVLSENRVISSDQGVFADDFEPYEVHIYSTGEEPVPKTVDTDSKTMSPVKGLTGKWIWPADKQKVENATVFFRRVFLAPPSVSTAELLITADDNYRVYCNGKLIGENWEGSQGGWYLAQRYDLTSTIKASAKNVISVEVKNDTSWAGLFAELTVDGRVLLTTNRKWRVSSSGPEGWTGVSFEDSSWLLADECERAPDGGPWRSFLMPSALTPALE